MWVAPDFRGCGIGAALLGALEKNALDMQYDTVRLDTSRYNVAAIAMYRRYGYQEIEPYNVNDYADFWFEKQLRKANDDEKQL